MDALGVIVLVTISKEYFFVSLPKKQQNDTVEPFGHLQWSLKSPDYTIYWKATQNFDFLILKSSLPGQFLGSSDSRRYHSIFKLLVAT